MQIYKQCRQVLLSDVPAELFPIGYLADWIAGLLEISFPDRAVKHALATNSDRDPALAVGGDTVELECIR
jgi:hypothetical protein